jgi:uncharacterized membrane protein
MNPWSASGWTTTFSYALTGAVRVYPRASVRPLDVDSAQLMAFVVSGGVTEMPDKEPPAT